MKVYVVSVFDRSNCPSTTELIEIFSTAEKAKSYVDLHKKDYGSLQELFFEEKTVK